MPDPTSEKIIVANAEHKPPAQLEIGKPSSSMVETLFSQKEKIHQDLTQTGQRRMLIRSLVQADEQTREQILHTNLAAQVFDSNEFQNNIVVAGSELDKIIKDPDNRSLLESYLWQKAIVSNPDLANISLSYLPAELFAKSDDKNSLGEARKFVAKNDAKLAEYFKSNEANKNLRIPLVEEILLVMEDKYLAEMGIEILTDPKAASEYERVWVKHEKNRKGRIIISDSYADIAQKIETYERTNGRNHKLAVAAIYGPPGRGKTEFIRTVSPKDVMVITARPYLGFEELMAMPQVVNQDKAGNILNLIPVYEQSKAEIVVANLITLAQKDAQRIIDANPNIRPEQANLLRKNWLVSMGMSDEIATKMAEITDDKILSMKVYPDILRNSAETIKTLFLNKLLNLAGENAFIAQKEQTTQYLKGLIITADELNMRVLIDEAEKMYESRQGNESFAGLEDVLNSKPGDVFRMGSLSHRWSEDFGIYISMNQPDIPEHIKSRFGGDRTFYFEEKAHDRISIVLTELTDKKGNLLVSEATQEKLLFLATNAWPVLEKAAQENKIPWDLRTLQGVISGLILDGIPRDASLADVLERFRNQPVIAKTLANYPGFNQVIDLSSFTETSLQEIAEGGLEERDGISPLQNAFLNAPTEINYTFKGKTSPLSEAEVQKLSRLQINEKPNNENSVESAVSVLTISGTTESPKIIVSLPGDDIMSEISLNLNKKLPDINTLFISEIDAYGRKIVCSLDNKFFAVDTQNMEFSEQGGVSINAVQVSPEIAVPKTVKISPDGSSLYYVNDRGELIMQTLGKIDGKNYFPEAVLNSVTEGWQNTEIQMTKDGNYALIYQKNGNNVRCNILNLAKTQKTGKAVYVFSENNSMQGQGWRLQTFKNILYLYNPQAQKGWQIT